MKLHDLSPADGSTKNRKRLGRGRGSGTGKTAGRGHKGQKSRSGYSSRIGFEGGQMPLIRRVPKRGFTNIFALKYKVVNTGRLQAAIDAGRLDTDEPLDAAALKSAGLVKSAPDGIRLLAKGELKSKIDLVVAHASKAAIAAVEKAGGKVTVTAPKATEAT